MKSLKQILAEVKMPAVKAFKDVNIGDKAVDADFYEDDLGKVVWKGSYKELLKSKYKALADDLAEFDENPEDLDYNWVIVADPEYGSTLFNYDEDPSGAVVLK